MTDFDAVLAALHAGHEELAGLVEPLAPEELTGGSGAAQWDISQVLSHLGSGAVITMASLGAAAAGRAAPGIEANREIWARWDAMTPPERAAGFLSADADLLAWFDALDGETRQSLRTNLGFLPVEVDLGTASRFRLNEFALHSWDVRVAFDPAAAVHPLATPLLLDQVTMMLGWLAKPAGLVGDGVALAVELADPDGAFGLTLGESAAIGEVPATPDGVLSAPAEAWLRLVAGRLGAAHTPAAVSVTGPVSLDALRQVFPGY